MRAAGCDSPAPPDSKSATATTEPHLTNNPRRYSCKPPPYICQVDTRRVSPRRRSDRGEPTHFPPLAPMCAIFRLTEGGRSGDAGNKCRRHGQAAAVAAVKTAINFYLYPDEYRFYPANTDLLRAISDHTGGDIRPGGGRHFCVLRVDDVCPEAPVAAARQPGPAFLPTRHRFGARPLVLGKTSSGRDVASNLISPELSESSGGWPRHR